MDTVTYPDPRVIEVIREQFVPVRINTAEPDEPVKHLMREQRMAWTPRNRGRPWFRLSGHVV